MRFARLKIHDYRGEGYYFITFATAPRRALLSEIRDGQIRLLPEGRAVVEAWQRMPDDEPAYSLRINVVMPDHFHGILVCRGGARYSLSQVVERMKARSRQAIRKLKNAPTLDVWEKGFHDFVAFTPETFNAFADYVRYKPRGHVAAKRLASGLTLVLSGFPDTEDEASPHRQKCLLNNRWAHAIASI